MRLRLTEREQRLYLKCPLAECTYDLRGRAGARCIYHGDHLVAPGCEAMTPLLGRYRAIETLEKGGFATILLAIDNQAKVGDGLVVIKRLHAEHRGPDKSAQLRFRTEGEILEDFADVPGVVGLITSVVDENERLLVLEYIDGINLRQCIDRFERLTADRASRVTMSLLAILSEVHRRRVVHRDLKPENVMITELATEPNEATRLCLLDFGISKRLDGTGRGTAAITAQGLVIGTLAYMAPEQRVGKPADERSDVYSVGAILYHMLAGRAPFEGSPYEIAALHEGAMPRPLPDGALVPKEVEAVLWKAMATDPEKRFESADAMLNAMRAATGYAIPSLVNAVPRPRGRMTAQGSMEPGAPAPLEATEAITAPDERTPDALDPDEPASDEPPSDEPASDEPPPPRRTVNARRAAPATSDDRRAPAPAGRRTAVAPDAPPIRPPAVPLLTPFVWPPPPAGHPASHGAAATARPVLPARSPALGGAAPAASSPEPMSVRRPARWPEGYGLGVAAAALLAFVLGAGTTLALRAGASEAGATLASTSIAPRLPPPLTLDQQPLSVLHFVSYSAGLRVEEPVVAAAPVQVKRRNVERPRPPKPVLPDLKPQP